MSFQTKTQTIGEVAKHKNSKGPEALAQVLVEVEAHAKINEAIALFEGYQITTLLVWGKPGHWLGMGDPSLTTHKGKQYLCVLSLVDVLIYLLQDPSKRSEHDSVMAACGSSLESQSLWVVPPLEPLSTVIEAMAKGIHTFLVASSNMTEAADILSQTDILSFVMAKADPALLEKLEVPLNELMEFGTKHLESAKLEDTVAETLIKMTSHAIKSVVITDEHGNVIDYLSISDLREYLAAASEMTLDYSSLEYLKTINVKEFLVALRGGVDKNPGVIVLATQTLAETINYALDNHVHRVWVVTSIVKHDRKPVGIASYTDMLLAIHKITFK